MSLKFDEWYQGKHGYSPFPWQLSLAERVLAGQPPESISTPTASGKTAIIAAWHYAVEIGAKVPTRLIYIVDRRLIVDSVTEYAEKIGCTVIKMRGGVTIDDSWMLNPHEPVVIVSTVDQAGSRLLWRGYGVSPKSAPIHAALIGNDAMIVLDEAHISTPFAETLKQIMNLRPPSILPWHVVTMTATPVTDDRTMTLSAKDYAHPVLKKRLASKKIVKLVKPSDEQFLSTMVKEANLLMADVKGVVAVVCNTTKHARAIFAKLPGEKILLTGRVRPADKDEILNQYLPQMLSGSRGRGRQPLFVVATQTIEVGADLDFDALVTQNAPIDALQQRFGRLDRLGELQACQGAIVYLDLGKDQDCKVYGKKILKSTWSWLKKIQHGKGKNKRVDFGVLAIKKAIEASSPPMREISLPFPLSHTDLRCLRQTMPSVDMDISPWLHGDDKDNITVQVVWREDLPCETEQWVEIVQAAPPVMAEAMPCPIYEVVRWLGRRSVVVGDRVVRGDSIRGGCMIVIPTRYGGYDEWGWMPQKCDPVKDLGNQVGAKFRLVGAGEDSDIPELLKEANAPFVKPLITFYPAGVIVTETPRRKRSGDEVALSDHLDNVFEVAKNFSADEAVRQAARLHDIGKQDPRFQTMLGACSTPLAKSNHISPWAAKVARSMSGLPKGWRHEVASVSMLSDEVSDLLKYLVGTHHGYNRSVLSISGDFALWHKAGGSDWGSMTCRLNEEYGAWQLAYLEAMVRLADWVQSKSEE
ncbi:type I-G CRISPR-associated helicase/endonuclease Cas3g [Desulfotalea psychrophila]|uniref:HD Cas3-type domain-containing protein n=1 Tax=Desulfotalea psychrophila (strain LSv54 / DSM 12343) TaxID=177439 RepID=Q6ARW0_DESPS|nr:type I-U CRISPR-associated helicase/endonuclease Cas3 [Desulfotalea psychrophila]CAG34915.1 hypothetical protein DP0186 [Desulfotalea psychrophila LSv54]